jgi:NAD(P)-dependent dehydrogenase (short-subunit alcohol dehydrogenase family)
VNERAAAPPDFAVDVWADFRGLGFAEGDVAVVTGAGNGIGRSAALLLARSGVTVAGWDVDEQALAAVAADARAFGGEVVPVAADVAETGDIERAWDRTDGVDGVVRYVVNNAGPPSTMQLTVAEGVRIAIGSYAAVTEGFVARHADDAASVTFTASVAGNFRGGGAADWYPAAKAGIAGYARHLAVAHRGRPRANVVAPGLTVTPRTAERFSSAAMQERLTHHPLGRAGAAHEVAAVICFLLSPAASYVNGVVVPVDGGAVLAS